MGLRATPLRSRVFAILLAEKRPIGAYEVMDRLRDDGKTIHPPVVYRILHFLEENGFIHRIASRKAYTACTGSHESGQYALLICRSCKSVEEVDLADDGTTFVDLARAAGFQVEQTFLEMEGLCLHCS